MKSEMNGIGTSESIPDIQDQGISPHGFWLLTKEREYFLDFESFPWFKEAKIDQIFSVKLLNGHHLFWNELDVDLELDSLDDPERFPLVSKTS